jgi:hypothetical protein
MQLCNSSEIKVFVTFSKSDVKVVNLPYNRRLVVHSVLVSGHHLGPATNYSFTAMKIIFRHLGDIGYGAASLTRGRACNLQLLLCFLSVPE